MDYFEQLEKNGYLKISNFFPDSLASSSRKKIVRTTSPHEWCQRIKPYPALLSANTRGQNRVKSCYLRALKAKRAKRFAFSFKRSRYIEEPHSVLSNIAFNIRNKIIEKLSEQLPINGLTMGGFIASYTKGDFLTYHSDNIHGKYAFVYNLSKGWQPKFGGQLELYPKRHRFYKKVLIPEFNSLLLLKLDYPMYHQVNMLSSPSFKQRINVTGWLL
jgi:Rps23 Pro-64 3,4-dihydroxylase Tpa1-like proline 4-hydroxylase